MSAFFEIKLKDGNKVVVEITRRGKLLFHDYDLEYDYAMAEFGEEEALPMTMVKYWNNKDFEFPEDDGPMNVIISNLNIKTDALKKLALDFFYHSFSQSSGSLGHQRYPDYKAVYDYIHEGVGSANDLHIRSMAIDPLEISKRTAMWHLDYAMARLLLLALKSQRPEKPRKEFIGLFVQVSMHSRDAVATKHCRDLGSSVFKMKRFEDALGSYTEFRPTKEYSKFIGRELGWQIRRFAHVMEAEQKGLPRPTVGATK